MNEKNESAASAAGEVAAAPAAAETNAVVHPTQPPVPVDPVPSPRKRELMDGGLTEQQADDHIRDEQRQLEKESDLRDRGDSDNQRQRVVTLGETVYYGDGSGQVWPATVVHVYDDSVSRPSAGIIDSRVVSANSKHVDLQVFKRKHITDVENVAFHEFDPPRSLNGWIFKA